MPCDRNPHVGELILSLGSRLGLAAFRSKLSQLPGLLQAGSQPDSQLNAGTIVSRNLAGSMEEGMCLLTRRKKKILNDREVEKILLFFIISSWTRSFSIDSGSFPAALDPEPA